MKQLGVVQAAHYYGPLGGIERVVYQFCQGLKGRYAVRAVVSNTEPVTTHSVEEGVPVTRVARLLHVRRMSLCPSFPYWLRASDPDLVHVHMTNPMAEASLLFSGLRCKLIATYHMDVTRQRLLNIPYSPLQKLFLDRAEVITTSSENFARTSPVLSRYLHKVRVLPYGLAENALVETERSRALLAELRRDVTSPVVLFVGRLIHYKGVEVLVEAMREVEATCLIVGEGYLKGALERRIAELGLEGRVRLVGRIEDQELVAYYDRADVFALPSVNRTESYGLTQIEAMSRGTPVVCTEVGTGTSFINLHGETGLVVPPGDSGALAGAINAILSDEKLKIRLGDNGRARATTVFTERKMLENLRALYEEVLG